MTRRVKHGSLLPFNEDLREFDPPEILRTWFVFHLYSEDDEKWGCTGLLLTSGFALVVGAVDGIFRDAAGKLWIDVGAWTQDEVDGLVCASIKSGGLLRALDTFPFRFVGAPQGSNVETSLAADQVVWAFPLDDYHRLVKGGPK